MPFVNLQLSLFLFKTFNLDEFGFQAAYLDQASETSLSSSLMLVVRDIFMQGAFSSEPILTFLSLVYGLFRSYSPIWINWYPVINLLTLNYGASFLYINRNMNFLFNELGLMS